MGKRTWQEDAELTKVRPAIENKFIIDFEDFEKLHKLYKFKCKGDYFVDRKRNKAVTVVKKDLLKPNKYVIYFNQDWLFQEAYDTKSETVIKIMKKYPELSYLYKLLQDKIEESNKRFKKWIASYSLSEDGEENDEEFL